MAASAWPLSAAITPQAMLSFHIHGRRITKNSPFKIWWVAKKTARLAIKRYSFVENKPGKTAYCTSGLTVVALTNQTVLSFQKLSTQCSAGTGMRPNATSISLMSRRVNAPAPLSLYWNRRSSEASGSPGAGHSKSFLLHYPSSFFLVRVNDLVTRSH